MLDGDASSDLLAEVATTPIAFVVVVINAMILHSVDVLLTVIRHFDGSGCCSGQTRRRRLFCCPAAEKLTAKLRSSLDRARRKWKLGVVESK
jgi:hypothetical protein